MIFTFAVLLALAYLIYRFFVKIPKNREKSFNHFREEPYYIYDDDFDEE